MESSLDHKQRLQRVFFPNGVTVTNLPIQLLPSHTFDIAGPEGTNPTCRQYFQVRELAGLTRTSGLEWGTMLHVRRTSHSSCSDQFVP